MSGHATFSENIQKDSDLYPHLIRADQILRKVIGPKRRDRVEANWAFIDDGRFQKVVRLQLKDDVGEVEGSFTESELRNEDRLYRRLNWLWGKLLEIRVDKSYEELQGCAQTGDQGVSEDGAVISSGAVATDCYKT